MKHLIETTNPSGLATVRYDRIVLNSSTNDVIVKGGGYEYVDLGLPSHLKWAKCNVGAEKETDYGDYFMWGSVTPYTDGELDWSTYKYCNGSYDTLTKYNTSTDYGKNPDDKTTLDSEDDAARVNMGGDWRMPTEAECEEIINNTDSEWIEDYNGTGVNGMKFTSKTDKSKYIFIPMAGYYDGGFADTPACVWSSSINNSFPFNAYLCEFYYSDFNQMDYLDRYYAIPVRGVFK